MRMVSKEKFHKVYLQCLGRLEKYITPDMVSDMAHHDRSWAREGWSLTNYYRAEWEDYWRAYKTACQNTGDRARICDCGGLIGMFGIVMRKLGFEVTIIEALKYYGDAFEGLYQFLGSGGVEFIDFDMFDTSSYVDDSIKYDVVFSMAVIEHYPYSHRRYFENLLRLAGDGKIYVTAPNIAFIHKRIELFFHGITPLADIREVYDSEVPFTGHCHEMTMSELEQLVELCGGRVMAKSYDTNCYYGGRLTKPLFKAIQHRIPSTRECLAILFERNRNIDY